MIQVNVRHDIVFDLAGLSFSRVAGMADPMMPGPMTPILSPMTLRPQRFNILLP
jgi:hypothetical protein